MLITPQQCRAARAWLDWSQQELANKANVARATVAEFERESRIPVHNNLVAISNALRSVGIDFFIDNGRIGLMTFGDKIYNCGDRRYNFDCESIDFTFEYKGNHFVARVTREAIDDKLKQNTENLLKSFDSIFDNCLDVLNLKMQTHSLDEKIVLINKSSDLSLK